MISYYMSKRLLKLFRPPHERFLICNFPFYKFSGEKISPIEVDAVLVSHPEIAQAVAFGVPDDKYGEEVRL